MDEKEQKKKKKKEELPIRRGKQTVSSNLQRNKKKYRKKNRMTHDRR